MSAYRVKKPLPGREPIRTLDFRMSRHARLEAWCFMWNVDVVAVGLAIVVGLLAFLRWGR